MQNYNLNNKGKDQRVEKWINNEKMDENSNLV